MNLKNLPNNICALPFTAVHFRSTGKIGPCCDFNEKYMFDGFDTGKYLESESLKDTKDTFLRGEWPKGCITCKIQEERTGHSRRLQETPNFLGHLPTNTLEPYMLTEFNKLFYLNLGLNNKCNLGCIMCSSSNSSFLMHEMHQNSAHFLKEGTSNDTNIYTNDPVYENPFNTRMTDEQIDDLVNMIDIDHKATRITFHGGEPSIMKEPYDILTKIKERNIQDKVIVSFNSNFNQYNEKWFEAVSEFESQALISLDAIGKQGEYIRWPSNWNIIESNILRFKESYGSKVRITICPTIQILNVLHLCDLNKWCLENDLELTFNGILQWPNILSISNLPNNLKENLKKELEILDYTSGFGRDERPNIYKCLDQDPTNHLNETRNWLDRIDMIRGTNWKECFPYLDYNNE